MSRSLTQIYAEAVTSRNNFMQLTNMQPSDVNKSKLSIINLMTYVMAVLIYSYETILDVFQIDIASFISSRINGTGAWYAYMATLFQYDKDTGLADTMQINPQTFKPEYTNISIDKRVVAKSAYTEDDDQYDIVLKVCKAGGEESTYLPLSEKEMTGFTLYMESIKFVGTRIRYISKPGDILTVKATVYYSDTYASAEDVFNSIKNNLTNYAKKLDYNAFIYYQNIVDCISGAENVESVESGVEVEMQSYGHSEYEQAVTIKNRARALSGYAIFTRPDGKTTINTDNIVLKPLSEIE